jgi:hypothetical protein
VIAAGGAGPVGNRGDRGSWGDVVADGREFTPVGSWPPGPIVVGATGGSGTRLVSGLLRRVGVAMGDAVNGADDSLPLALFFDLWVNAWAARDAWFEPAEAVVLEAAMTRSLRHALARHLGATPTGPWGWKEPNSIYLLPFLDARVQGLRFVHLVRDGRDMAFSENQRQLTKHGRPYLAGIESTLRSPQERSAALWARINAAAHDHGERSMGGRYLPVRFEDLCAEPAVQIDRLLAFAGVRGDAERLAQEEVRPPASLGRWRTQDPRLLGRVRAVAGLADALARFGYPAT